MIHELHDTVLPHADLTQTKDMLFVRAPVNDLGIDIAMSENAECNKVENRGQCCGAELLVHLAHWFLCDDMMTGWSFDRPLPGLEAEAGCVGACISLVRPSNCCCKEPAPCVAAH